MVDETGIPDISVVIPCYNAEKWVGRAIDSVLAPQGVLVELIVIDDGSKDDSASIIKGYSNVKYFFQEQMGAPSARNRGLLEVQSSHIIFLDADDYFEPGFIEIVINELEIYSDFDMLLFGYRKETSGQIGAKVTLDLNDPSPSIFFEAYLREPLQTGAIVWSRSFLREFGGWDNSLYAYQDIDLVIRALLQNPRIICSSRDGPGVVYVQHNSKTRISNTLSEEKALSILKTLTAAELTCKRLETKELYGFIAPFYRALAMKAFSVDLIAIGNYASARARTLGGHATYGSRFGYLMNIFLGEERKWLLSGKIRSVTSWLR